MKRIFFVIALFLVPALAYATPNGVAKLKKSYGDVHKVPWKQLAYRSSSGRYFKASANGTMTVSQVIYADLDYDMKDEVLVVIAEGDDPGVMGDEPAYYALVYGVVQGKVRLLGDVTPPQNFAVGADVLEPDDGNRAFEVKWQDDDQERSVFWSMDERGKLVDHI